jgi:hypothetical protein
MPRWCVTWTKSPCHHDSGMPAQCQCIVAAEQQFRRSHLLRPDVKTAGCPEGALACRAGNSGSLSRCAQRAPRTLVGPLGRLKLSHVNPGRTSRRRFGGDCGRPRRRRKRPFCGLPDVSRRPLDHLLTHMLNRLERPFRIEILDVLAAISAAVQLGVTRLRCRGHRGWFCANSSLHRLLGHYFSSDFDLTRMAMRQPPAGRQQ